MCLFSVISAWVSLLSFMELLLRKWILPHLLPFGVGRAGVENGIVRTLHAIIIYGGTRNVLLLSKSLCNVHVFCHWRNQIVSRDVFVSTRNVGDIVSLAFLF